MLLRFAGLAHERVAITAALNVQAHGMTKNLRFFIFKGVANGSVHYGTACPESYRYLAGIVQVSRLPAFEERKHTYTSTLPRNAHCRSAFIEVSESSLYFFLGCS